MTARGEWRWVVLASLLTLAITTAPTMAGYLAQTPDKRFVGAVYDVQDYNSHLAKMWLGARGELGYRSLFTPEPHRSEPLVLPYILLGFAASRLGVSLPVAYELWRWGGGLALLLAAYQLIALILPNQTTRRLAFTLTIVASGLGWLVVRTQAFSFPHQSPIDFWLADGYVLFSIMAFPHFGWSGAALLLSLVVWWRYAGQPRPVWLVQLAGLSALLGFIQVFELPLLNAVLALDALRRAFRNRATLRPSLIAGLTVCAVEAVVVWPYVSALRTNRMFQMWAQQNNTPSPPPLYYLVGYGLLWPLVLLGMAWAWRRRDERLALPALWVGTVAVLVYLPVYVQRRWLLGIQVPLAILAAVGLEQVLIPAVVRRFSARGTEVRWRWWLTNMSVLATMPSAILLIGGHTRLAATQWRQAFLTGGEAAAITWLGENSRPDDTVLADPEIGNAIPGRIGHRVFYGHWVETMDVEQKAGLVAAFFAEMPDASRRALLRDYSVRFVFFGPRAHGGFDQGRVPYLAERFRSADSAIFEVVAP